MTHEKEIRAVSGWLMLFVEIALLLASGFGLYRSIEYAAAQQPFGWLMFFSLLGLSVAGIFMAGFFVVEPNGSKVLLLFGKYKGTVKDAGFHWTNPFMTKRSLSLRVRTLNGDRLKVNDLAGNPVEIAAIVVWQLRGGRLRAVRHASE
jgi:regulator of protease activity HflC (stomatin/prohibitin superfamily)